MTTQASKKAPAKKAAPKKAAVAKAPIDPSKPAVFGAMAAVMDQIEAIGKDSKNKQQGWTFRGIDAAYNAIHPLLANNRLVTVPRVLGLISRMTVPTKNGGSMNYTMLSTEYDFICAIDGSKITVGPIYGEGMDSGDKSTAKALAVCHKYAIFQTFCIPTSDMPDGDSETHDVVMPAATLMPMGANQTVPSLMPVATAADVPMAPAPATGSLMPQVAVNTPPVNTAGLAMAAGNPPVTAPEQPVEEFTDAIVIEDEMAAGVSADMLINLVEMHKGSLESLSEFWHLSQAVLKILNQNFPSQYKRVADIFAGYKSALQPQPQG
jgi:hypothetical protein